MYPLKSNKIKCTSKYGVKRKYTVNGKTYTDIHKGIDLVAEPRDNNCKILAVSDGTVSSVRKKGVNGGDGCYVRIKHKNYYSLYYHMKSDSITVNKGDKVKKGQILGTIGMTGRATGVHLHFQIDKGSSENAIDPTDYAYGKKELESDTKINKKKILHLPASATRWRVYPLGKPARVGYECGYLKPSKFGGLDYNIIKMVSSNVAIIKTLDFGKENDGKVQIYIGKETGAIISDS